MGVNGIYGLSGSGLDIESMVKVGMMSKQNEYDKMAQKYTKNEWTKTAYLELNSSINTFNNSTLSTYKYSSTMNAKEAESTSSAVKVSANANAAVMSHKVEVTGLASAAYLVGTNSMTRYNTDTGAKLTDSTSTKLADVLFKKLEQHGNYVSGIIAVTDMEDNSRDVSGYTDADDKSISSEWKFGKQDLTVPAHWEDSDGNTVTSSNTTVETALQTAFTGDSSSTNSLRWSNSSNAWRESDGNGGWNTISYSQAFDKILADPNLREIAKGSSADLTYVASKTTKAGQNADTVRLTNDAFSFTISDGVTKNENGTLKEVTIHYSYSDLMGDDGKTFADLVSDINNAGLNIKASYDAVYDKFSFYNTKSGGENTIQITLGEYENYDGARASLATRNFFNNMGLYQSKNGDLYGSDGSPATESDANYLKFNVANGSKSNGVNSFTGSDGEMKIDGVTYSMTDNKVTVNNVIYTALDRTEGTPATVSVTQDVDAIVDKVKSFVEDYNKMLASLYEKYDEKSDSNYKPLTQSQKDAMKEEQITKWEEKAKKGLLYHDQTIGKIINEMRSAISDPIDGVEGKYNSAYSIGISTTGLKGQLKLDEDKLRKALAEDSESVSRVFTTLKDANETDTDKMGVAQRLGDILSNAAKTIKTRAGSSSDITEDSDLNNLLRNLQTKMSNFKKLMNSFEDALYKKYDAMETALARLGSQLNFVTSSFQ